MTEVLPAPLAPLRRNVSLALAQRVALDAVQAAGALIRDGARSDLGLRSKGSAGDVVTDLDECAEQLIVRRIRALFPDHRVIAEEAGVLDATNDTWTWLVDPLDGTNNLAVALPTYVVGVALCHDRVPVLGVVHDPVTGGTWHAMRGAGALGPGERPIRPPARHHPAGPRLAWTQGYSVARDDVTAGALKLTLDSAGRRLFQLWTPLLSLVMLARGDIDGMVGYQPEEIDLPAGALIATEAGIVMYGLDGAPFDQRIGRSQADRSFLACRPEHVERLLDLVHTAERIAPEVENLLARLPTKTW